MARKLCFCSGKPAIDEDITKIDCDIEMSSLLFGGGAEAGKVDNKYPIRETEIRGMLRFWWRATMGARYLNYQTMREAESAIWGATDMPSSVNVKVSVDETDVQENTEQKIAYNNNKGEWRFSENYSYILFPWNKPKEPEKDKDYLEDECGKTICKKIDKFNLVLEYSVKNFNKNIELQVKRDIKEKNAVATEEEIKIKVKEKLRYLELDGSDALKNNIETALKAWINFGGYGARTRRGCGALYCDRYSFKNNDEIKKYLKDIPNNKDNKDKKWPTLGDVFISDDNSNDNDKWMKLIKIYREFRQQRTPVDKNKGDKHPHRSYWPEPDALRRITRKHSNGHEPMNYNPDKVFPRAELGLPIMFEIRGEVEPGKNVVPEKGERFSSPVIISRSLSRSLPVFVFLNGPRPDKVKIDNETYPVKWVETSPDNPRRVNLVTKSGSALDKFKEHIKQEGFKSLRESK